MSFPAAPLEGFIVVLQHQPDVARRLESALSHAGATVFLGSISRETIEIMKRYQAHLVVMDMVDADQALNEHVAFAAFYNEHCASICYSSKLPEYGLINLGRWVDIGLPVSAVVDEAVACRRRLKV